MTDELKQASYYIADVDSLRAELARANFASQRWYDECQAVRLELMPLLESEDPAEAVRELKAENHRLTEAVAAALDIIGNTTVKHLTGEHMHNVDRFNAAMQNLPPAPAPAKDGAK